jgi:hypothetical protein
VIVYLPAPDFKVKLTTGFVVFGCWFVLAEGFGVAGAEEVGVTEGFGVAVGAGDDSGVDIGEAAVEF